MNSPERCVDIHNIVNLSSEHERVAMTIKMEGVIIKIQFITVRSFKNLNAMKILVKLDKVNGFEDKKAMSDPNRIAEGIKTKINKVIQDLAPSKRIQMSKKITYPLKQKSFL